MGGGTVFSTLELTPLPMPGWRGLEEVLSRSQGCLRTDPLIAQPLHHVVHHRDIAHRPIDLGGMGTPCLTAGRQGRLGRLAQEAFQGRPKDHPRKVLLDRQDTGGTEPLYCKDVLDPTLIGFTAPAPSLALLKVGGGRGLCVPQLGPPHCYCPGRQHTLHQPHLQGWGSGVFGDQGLGLGGNLQGHHLIPLRGRPTLIHRAEAPVRKPAHPMPRVSA